MPKVSIGIELVGTGILVNCKMRKPPTQSTTSSSQTEANTFLVEMNPTDTIENVKAKIQENYGFANELLWDGNVLADTLTHEALARAVRLAAVFLAAMEKEEDPAALEPDADSSD